LFEHKPGSEGMRKEEDEEESKVAARPARL
jgi:hypothetical protein